MAKGGLRRIAECLGRREALNGTRTMRPRRPVLMVAAAFAASALYSPMLAWEHGQMSVMPQTCQSRMNSIFNDYYNITVLDGTMNCTNIILSELNNANGVNCTTPQDVRACFNVRFWPPAS